MAMTRTFRLHGHSDNLDDGGFQSFAGSDITLDIPTSATTLAVASTDNTDDTSGGDGALTVRVYGLDANWEATHEDFTLNGQTKVTGSVSMLRTSGARVLTAGADGVNAGTIWVGKSDATFTAGVPAAGSRYRTIDVGFNKCACGQWVVPAGHQARLTDILFSAQNANAKVVTLRLETRDNGDNGTGLWEVHSETHFSDNGFSTKDSDVFGEKTDIRFRVDVSASDAQASCIALFEVINGTRWEAF